MTDIVELSIPVTADLVVLARLTASTVASRANFDVEEIADLRLAVDELCISIAHDRTDGRLALRFIRDDDDDVEVSCTYVPASGVGSNGRRTPTPDGLSERILDALVDEHGYGDEAGPARAWLRKRRVRQDL
jgi:serine/threonine-protein kinase RsbW